MKRAFRTDLHLSKINTDRLLTINSIIDEYASDGYKLTLRQLYYQLVSRDKIPNAQKEYAKLSTLLVKGRMAGVVDWAAIEDRLRVPYLPYWVTDVPGAIKDTIDQYRLDRQEDQDRYIELWVEKDALSGVLRRVTQQYHIRLMVNRGYSSCSAMYAAYNRLLIPELDDKETTILYLGDHDPSGLDMVRDITDRLNEFGVYPTVEHIALTMDQIEEHRPPPNPTKITDPRAKEYLSNFGNTSWEVDALTPQTLTRLIESRLHDLIDIEQFDLQLLREERDKETLKKFMEPKE